MREYISLVQFEHKGVKEIEEKGTLGESFIDTVGFNLLLYSYFSRVQFIFRALRFTAVKIFLSRFFAKFTPTVYFCTTENMIE